MEMTEKRIYKHEQDKLRIVQGKKTRDQCPYDKDVKVFNKILAVQSQQYSTRILHNRHVGFTQEMKADITLENQSR